MKLELGNDDDDDVKHRAVQCCWVRRRRLTTPAIDCGTCLFCRARKSRHGFRGCCNVTDANTMSSLSSLTADADNALFFLSGRAPATAIVARRSSVAQMRSTRSGFEEHWFIVGTLIKIDSSQLSRYSLARGLRA